MTSFGTYEVLGIIGDGGMGTVYKARDPRFDRLVAIKALHPQLQRDPSVVERFRNEAVIQAKLHHPNIVTVYDFVDDGQNLGMVMEYVDGRPLDQMITEARGPMPPGRAVAIMTQVLAAIDWAHEHGLVHRDLKPSNILIEELHGDLIARVTDFGVAKVLGSEKLKTATGAKMGTLAYMSPEHLQSPKNVDQRSDIYSLGITLYEMLTGVVPFEADTEYEMMRQIVSQAPARPMSIAYSIPPGLDWVVMKAIDKEPSSRFQSCTEFRQAIVDASSAGRVGPAAQQPAAPTPGGHRDVRQAPRPSSPSVGVATGELQFSGFLLRFAAAFIDFFVLWVPFLIIMGIADEEPGGSWILILLTGWLYFALSESSKHGGTVGKRAVGIRVCEKDGRQIGFGKASGRYFSKIISTLFLGIGFIMAGTTKHKQALHDIMADCYVVMKKKEPRLPSGRAVT
jgi:uncharacterized RDD family membrane protein YckC/tRNA A-37 threonylcarbamoyl transferase component Bud32